MKNTKRNRLKISNIDDFKELLKSEGYSINEFNDEIFKEDIIKIFNIDNFVVEVLYEKLNDNDITYKVDDLDDFIRYIKNSILIEDEHNKLSEKISNIKKLYIDRVEYDRKPCIQEEVSHISMAIDNIKNKISSDEINEEEKLRLELLEKGIEENYIYAKDIELLKKMIISKGVDLEEEYNFETKTRTISIEIPSEINYNYIPVKEGSYEYHKHLINNIPRIQRLIKNIHKYLEECEEDNTFRINQSEALQDSINIAVCLFNGKEYKAISGSDEIEGYCITMPESIASFESCKVNKLGQLGIGYNRLFDSEKKILEEIHKQIKNNQLKDEGNLTIYSKWEPCPSCYYVISQFCDLYPKINIQVKYNRTYGE